VPVEVLGTVRWGRRGRYLVPLEAAAPGRWFLRRLFAPHGGRERLRLRLARRLGGRLGPRLLLRDAGDGAAAELQPLARALAAVPELAAGPGDRWVVIAEEPGGRRRRQVAFRFAAAGGDGGGAPAAGPDRAVKTEPRRSAALAREAEALRRLRRELPPVLAETLPEVIHHHATDDLDVLVLSASAGTSGYVVARAAGTRCAAEQLAAAGRWLAAFQRATRCQDRTAPVPSWPRLAVAAGLPPEPPRWYRELERFTGGQPLPAVAAHGDFWPRNLLLPESADRLPAVVDWEAWREAASPLGDLFHYPLALGQLVRRRGGAPPEPLAAFRRAFVVDGPLSRQVAGYTRTVAVALDLPAALLAPLLRLYLLSAARGDLPAPSAFAAPASCLDAYRLLERSGCVLSG
jgi:hypothetical protein